MRADNRKIFTTLYSEYYDEEINISEIIKAIEAYLEWCEKERLTPEIGVWKTASDLSTIELDHVMYHYREVIK